jgi:hypothetical protein
VTSAPGLLGTVLYTLEDLSERPGEDRSSFLENPLRPSGIRDLEVEKIHFNVDYD